MAGEPDPDWETGWHAAAAGLWEEMGESCGAAYSFDGLWNAD